MHLTCIWHEELTFQIWAVIKPTVYRERKKCFSLGRILTEASFSTVRTSRATSNFPLWNKWRLRAISLLSVQIWHKNLKNIYVAADKFYTQNDHSSYSIQIFGYCICWRFFSDWNAKNAPLACSEPTGSRWARTPKEWLSTQLREIIYSEFHVIAFTEDNWELKAQRNVGIMLVYLGIYPWMTWCAEQKKEFSRSGAQYILKSDEIKRLMQSKVSIKLV